FFTHNRLIRSHPPRGHALPSPKRFSYLTRNCSSACADILDMSLPRQILPGTTYLLTRRCTQRQFLLRPHRATNLAFLYVLACACKRFSIQIPALCVMPNHWHCVFTDPEGNAPRFTEFVHKFTAKLINASLGRWENVWASEPPSLIPLRSKTDILDKI